MLEAPVVSIIRAKFCLNRDMRYRTIGLRLPYLSNVLPEGPWSVVSKVNALLLLYVELKYLRDRCSSVPVFCAQVEKLQVHQIDGALWSEQHAFWIRAECYRNGVAGA